MTDLLAAATSRERAVTGATHDNGDRAWRGWSMWCESIGCNDLYLDKFNQVERNLLFGAFAMAVREGRFTKDCTEPLVEGTVRGTISHVVQAFRESGRPIPRKTQTTCLASFYQGSSKPTKTMTPKKYIKRPFPCFASVAANIEYALESTLSVF